MNLVYKIVSAILRPVQLLLFPTRFSGRENVIEGPAVVCANHSSIVDPVLVCFAFGRKNILHFMAKVELFRIPVLGAILRGCGAYPVDRKKSDISAVRTSLKYLKDGEKIMLFPEGRRVQPDESTAAKNGAIMFASKTGAPVIPVYVSKYKRVFRRAKVVIGEPYIIPKLSTDSSKGELSSLSAELMEKIQALGGGEE